MKTYTVLYPEDGPHYGTREFEVADDTLATERAKSISPDAMRKYTNTRTTTHPVPPHHPHRRPRRHREDICLGPDDSLPDSAHHLAQALELAIRAMNAVPSCDTGITNPEHPEHTMSSYLPFVTHNGG